MEIEKEKEGEKRKKRKKKQERCTLRGWIDSNRRHFHPFVSQKMTPCFHSLLSFQSFFFFPFISLSFFLFFSLSLSQVSFHSFLLFKWNGSKKGIGRSFNSFLSSSCLLSCFVNSEKITSLKICKERWEKKGRKRKNERKRRNERGRERLFILNKIWKVCFINMLMICTFKKIDWKMRQRKNKKNKRKKENIEERKRWAKWKV